MTRSRLVSMVWMALPSIVSMALLAACGGGTAAGPASSPSAKPAPVTVFKNTLPGQNASAPFDLIQMVLEFAPGAATAKHIHPTPNVATVLEGAITVKLPDGDKTAQAGQTIVEPLNVPCLAMNAGSARALMLATYPVAPGGSPSKSVAGEPAPAVPNKTLYRHVLQSAALVGPYSVVQTELQLAPGAQTPRHKHGGPGIVTVLDGQLTLLTGNEEKTYSAGDSFVETPDQTLQAINRGSVPAMLAASFLLPDGAVLTTNVR